MPRYQVTAWVGTLTAEVEAENEDDAMLAAEIQWDEGNHWSDATYEVRELSD